MYYFNFLKKGRTYVPSYRSEFIRFSVHSFIFGFSLETFLILKGRYEKIYKSSFHKELMKVKEHDDRITDNKRKEILLNSKIMELNELEKKLESMK